MHRRTHTENMEPVQAIVRYFITRAGVTKRSMPELWPPLTHFLPSDPSPFCSFPASHSTLIDLAPPRIRCPSMPPHSVLLFAAPCQTSTSFLGRDCRCAS